jgi:TnpA family transposase
VSNLTDIAMRLHEIEKKQEEILAAVRASANETASVHQERVNLVSDVASLKRWREDHEELIRNLSRSSVLERVGRLEASRRAQEEP